MCFYTFISLKNLFFLISGLSSSIECFLRLFAFEYKMSCNSTEIRVFFQTLWFQTIEYFSWLTVMIHFPLCNSTPILVQQHLKSKIFFWTSVEVSAVLMSFIGAGLKIWGHFNVEALLFSTPRCHSEIEQTQV